MKLCVTFPNDSLHQLSPVLSMVSSVLSFEGWRVVNLTYVGEFYSSEEFIQNVNESLRATINDKDTEDVLFISEGYGANYAYYIGCRHSEDVVMIDPEFDEDDPFVIRSKNINSKILSVVSAESITLSSYPEVMDISTEIKLVDEDRCVNEIAFSVLEFVESRRGK